MQLTVYALVLVLFLYVQNIKAQVSNFYQQDNKGDRIADEHKELLYVKPEWKKIEINFLSSYYQQDGNNAAVTGGLGSEFLTDFGQKINVNLPLKQDLELNLDIGYDYYTSVSSDNVDRLRSNDSAADLRAYTSIGLSKSLSSLGKIGFNIGGSSEYDYTSFLTGINYEWISPSYNSSFSLSGQAFIDKIKLIYPKEIRRDVSLHRSDRQSYNLAFQFNQILNRKNQLSIQLEGVWMNGLLSTSFHRVYVQETELPVLERLPDSRFKIPIGLRWNSYLNDHFISRMHYRYYWDNWGIKSHSVSVELPYKVNRFFAIYPHARFHTQTGTRYFLPYGEHTIETAFRTSDFDLSAMNSWTYGIGIIYSPAKPISQQKIPLSNGRVLSLEGIDLKLSRYQRSTGLRGFMVGLGLKMKI